jgi:alpha-beta hydrolase superfamily lysophospholipase
VDWVDKVNLAVAAEAALLAVPQKVSVVGLSLGSALATIAMARSSMPRIKDETATPTTLVYNRAVLYPPFYGVSVPNVDRLVQNCQDNQDNCVAEFVDSTIKVRANQPSEPTITQEKS